MRKNLRIILYLCQKEKGKKEKQLIGYTQIIP